MRKSLNQISGWNLFTIVVFIFIFAIGVFTFKDYGISEDEAIQRRHSLVTHYYLRSVSRGDFSGTGKIVFNKNSNLEVLVRNLKVDRKIFLYSYKYYGVAVQIPLTIIEQVFHYTLDLSSIYFIRHFYTFFFFFLSLIFLYKLLTNYIVKDKKLALLAVFIMLLSPRIYGEAFYNIKDLMFLSLCIINLYFCFLYLNYPHKKNLIFLCFISALTMNCRIIGIIFVFMTFLFQLIKNRNHQLNSIKTSFSLFMITYIFYIILTPASWNHIFSFPFDVVNFFFNYKDPISQKLQQCYYFGKWMNSTSLPWHYLPIWIVITTPFLYIVLSIIGFITTILDHIKTKFKNINQEWLFCNIIFVFILLFVMIIRPTIYGGWRHFYFLYPIIVINAIIGIRFLISICKKVKITVVLLIIMNSLYIFTWMVKNHPYQYEYFGLFFRQYTIKNFDTNIWKVSNTDAINYIVNKENSFVLVYSENDISDYLLPNKKRKMIQIAGKDSLLDIHYIIDNSKFKTKKYNTEYEEVYHKEIDGYRLYTIYKRKDF